MLLSIIIPCYNEEESLSCFYLEVQKITEILFNKYGLCSELIFIDDGSKDRTLKLMRSFAEKDRKVKYISFSRNFGKESALLSGLKYARGNYVVVMDADMQDPPALLPKMFEMIKSGEYDSIATRRQNRKGEPPIRSFFARCFYKLINQISDADIVDGARDFRLMNRKMVNAILSMEEYNRFSKGIFGWVGFKTKWLSFENVERIAGKTKWSFWNLLKYSIQGIVAFSTVPLMFAFVIGFLVLLIAFIMIIYILIEFFVFDNFIEGWAFLACIALIMGGLHFICVGILGQYLAKSYLETKKRPIYIVAETNINNQIE